MADLKIDKRKPQSLKLSVLSFSFAFCALSFAPSCFASDIAFEATVDKNIVAIGESVQLSLTFQGTTDARPPQIKEPEGFTAKYLGPSTMMSIVNGKMSSSVSHIYVLMPLKTGKFTLGPFSAEYNGQKYMSQVINIEVADQPKQQQSPQTKSHFPGASAEEQLKDRIFVELEACPPQGAGKKDAYLNEIIPVHVRLYVNKLAIRDIGYPELTGDGFSKERFGKPDQYQKSLAGLVYDVIEFKTYAYPLKTGALSLGPAEIKCNLVSRRQQASKRQSPFDDFFGNDDFFNDFFTRYETYPLHLKSTEVPVNVKPMPLENKPADFSGAVGDFDMQLETDQTNVKAGDPITLKMTVTGVGNFSTVGAPALEDTKDFKVYQPAIKLEQDKKIFEQVVIPLSENVANIPVVSFSFFNPKQETYKTIKRGPIAITVSKPDQAGQMVKPKIIGVETPQWDVSTSTGVIPEKEDILGKDIAYIKDSPGIIIKKGKFLYQNKFFVWIFILPLAAFFVLFFIARHRDRLRTDIKYARTRGAFKKAHQGLVKAQAFLGQGRADDFYGILFKTLQDYIGDRLHIPSAGITADSARQYLKPKGAPDDCLYMLEEVFDACDSARFAASTVTKDDMSKAFNAAKEIIEMLEKVKI